MIFGLLLLALVVLFIRYLSRNDRGSKEPKRALWAAAGFGLLAAILAGELNSGLIPHNWIPLYPEGAGATHGQIAAGAILIGLIEESVKFLPLALFLRRKSYFNEITDGVIYFGIAALTFGSLEHILYAGEQGSGVGIMRLIVAPLLHPAFTIIIGLAFARYIVGGKSILGVLSAFLVAAGLHAFYDFGLFAKIVPLMIASLGLSLLLNIAIFKRFRAAQKEDEKMGRSAVGSNAFCRHCGRPNPKHFLYCKQCGNKA